MTENREERGLEARRSFYRSILENQTLMSDFLMNNVLKERKCTEYILQVIMGIGDLQVLEQVLQMDFKNLQGGPPFWTAWPGTREENCTT